MKCVFYEFGLCSVLVTALLYLTHWGRDKTAAIFQTTFSHAFSWMKMYEFRLKFHWSLFPTNPKAPIYNIPAFVQIMARCRPGDKSLSEPMLVSLPTYLCVTRPQQVNSVIFDQIIITPNCISYEICTWFCSLFCCGHIHGLVQDCSNSIANALELLQSCNKPSIFTWLTGFWSFLCFINPYSSGLLLWHTSSHACLDASKLTLKDMGCCAYK